MKNLIFILLFFTANLVGQIPPPLTGSGSTVRTSIGTSRSAPEDLLVQITDTLTCGRLSETVLHGIPDDGRLYEVEFQYGAYNSNLNWTVWAYENVIGSGSNGVYTHNFRFVDEFGELVTGNFGVFAHVFVHVDGVRQYYGYTAACSHVYQSADCPELEVTTLGGCDTVYVQVNNCPETLQVNCKTYWQAYPSHPFKGQIVTLNFENPQGNKVTYQLYDATRLKVVEEVSSTGINMQINTANLGVGTYYIYDISSGLQDCGTWTSIVVCSID